MTLEDLANIHSDKSSDYNENGYTFDLDQLRALITEAVGIVQGETVTYQCKVGLKGFQTKLLEGNTPDNWLPLHHNDLTRLK